MFSIQEVAKIFHNNIEPGVFHLTNNDKVVINSKFFFKKIDSICFHLINYYIK